MNFDWIQMSLDVSKIINTGVPQRCVFSLLYDCTAHSLSVKMFKFADDASLAGLISNNNAYGFQQWWTGVQPSLEEPKEVAVDFFYFWL